MFLQKHDCLSYIRLFAWDPSDFQYDDEEISKGSTVKKHKKGWTKM